MKVKYIVVERTVEAESFKKVKYIKSSAAGLL